MSVNLLEKLQEEYNSDIKIDGSSLQTETANNPVLYSKWLKTYSDIKQEILKLELKKTKALKERLDFYTGRGEEACLTVYERSEMKTVLAADNDILKIEAAIAINNNLLDFVSKALDNIKSRGYAIKNMIDLRKFEAGV